VLANTVPNTVSLMIKAQVYEPGSNKE